MSFSGKVLAEGQVASTKTTLYTVPVGKVAYIKLLNFLNTGANAETLLVYVKPGSTSRVFERQVLAENQKWYTDQTLLLEAGDLIEAQTTNANVVDYLICGVEETP